MKKMKITHTPLSSDAVRIWMAGVRAVDGERLVQNAIRVRGNRVEVGDTRVDLARGARLVVVGAGKAGAGMARGLVKQPPLLILDEPCQGLDRDNRDRLLRTIDSVGNLLDTSVIFVTHRYDELPNIITHVMRLDGGRVVERVRIDKDRPVSTIS